MKVHILAWTENCHALTEPGSLVTIFSTNRACQFPRNQSDNQLKKIRHSLKQISTTVPSSEAVSSNVRISSRIWFSGVARRTAVSGLAPAFWRSSSIFLLRSYRILSLRPVSWPMRARFASATGRCWNQSEGGRCINHAADAGAAVACRVHILPLQWITILMISFVLPSSSRTRPTTCGCYPVLITTM
jgi:hypothetical protein